MRLVTPENYEEHRGCSCGSEKARFDYVPDTVWGLSIKAACCIHDFMYGAGRSQWDKERADRIFLENMLAIIAANTKWGWLLWLRKQRAWAYYQAVVRFGGPSYWADKNQPVREEFENIGEAS
jgi:hypothetical protein